MAKQSVAEVRALPAREDFGLTHALHTSFNRIIGIGAPEHLLRLLASQIHFTLAVCQHEEVALRNLLVKVENKLRELKHEADSVAEYERRGVVIPRRAYLTFQRNGPARLHGCRAFLFFEFYDGREYGRIVGCGSWIKCTNPDSILTILCLPSHLRGINAKETFGVHSLQLTSITSTSV